MIDEAMMDRGHWTNLARMLWLNPYSFFFPKDILGFLVVTRMVLFWQYSIPIMP